MVKLLDGVGLVERWADWEKLDQEFSLVSNPFIWGEESSVDQVAKQLSRAR